MISVKRLTAAYVVLALALVALPAMAGEEVPHALGLRMSRPALRTALDSGEPVAVRQGKKAPVTAFSLVNFMPDSMDQGQVGSCASCAVGYAWASCTEGLRDDRLPNADTRTFNPMYLYSQVNGGGDNGSYFEDNLAVLCMRGITTMADQPYETDADALITWPSQGLCDMARAHRTKYVSAPKVILHKTLPATDPLDLAKIKALIMKGTPALVGIEVDDAFDDLYLGTTNFVWYPNGLHTYREGGGHALTLIGFNDAYDDGAGHVGAFEFQNSWGADWCLEGRAYIAYDAFYDNDSVGDEVFYGIARKEYTPRMKAQVAILHPSRGSVFIQVGVGDPAKPRWSEWFYYPLIINTLDGIWDVDNANIVTTLDLTGGAKYWPPTLKNDWWLRVSDSFGDGVTGSIVQFSVLGRTGGWMSAPGPTSMADMGDTYVHIGQSQ